MARVYARKILEQEVNRNTGKIWTLEDVPLKWRNSVKVILDNQ